MGNQALESEKKRSRLWPAIPSFFLGMKPRTLFLFVLAVAGICFLLGGVAGFFLGPAVQANISEPGSAGDPLVSRSYVDEKMTAYISELEVKIRELSDRAQQLEQEVAKLQKQVGVTPETTSPSSPDRSGASSGEDTTAPGAQEPDSGETDTRAGTTDSASAGEKLFYVDREEVDTYVILRSGPGTEYDAIGKVIPGDPASEPMTLIGQDIEWLQVRLPDGREGWVAGWLVTGETP